MCVLPLQTNALLDQRFQVKKARGAAPPPSMDADAIADNLPYLIPLALAVVVAVRYTAGVHPVPTDAPYFVMAAGVAAMLHVVYREATAMDGAHPDDFGALIAMSIAAGVLARWGVNLQANPSS